MLGLKDISSSKANGNISGASSAQQYYTKSKDKMKKPPPSINNISQENLGLDYDFRSVGQDTACSKRPPKVKSSARVGESANLRDITKDLQNFHTSQTTASLNTNEVVTTRISAKKQAIPTHTSQTYRKRSSEKQPGLLNMVVDTRMSPSHHI